MQNLLTDRLLLRPFQSSDFAAVHRYAGTPQHVQFMLWGPNTEEQTHAFLHRAIALATNEPCLNHQYAIVHRQDDQLIGGCNLSITARCDADNQTSYRVMKRIGMRREGLFLEARPAHRLSDRLFSDELLYAILRDEWETHLEIAHYNQMPVTFSDFIDLPELRDDRLYLVCVDKKPAIPEKARVPAYHFIICQNGETIGQINLRIGYTTELYYGGQIGYTIRPEFRGHGFAARACRLLDPVARAHGIRELLITNNQTNEASRRVCEKLGARHLRLARLPEWHNLYEEGQRFVNVYAWSL